MLTVAVANAKGGTLKTTLAVHLASGLARQGHRTLLVDLDPQGNASTWVLGDIPNSPGSADALKGHLKLEDTLPVPERPNLVRELLKTELRTKLYRAEVRVSTARRPSRRTRGRRGMTV